MIRFAPNIAAYQHPLMARVRELERRLADTLAAQLAAEREVSRLQQLAAGLELENRSMQARASRENARWQTAAQRRGGVEHDLVRVSQLSMRDWEVCSAGTARGTTLALQLRM